MRWRFWEALKRFRPGKLAPGLGRLLEQRGGPERPCKALDGPGRFLGTLEAPGRRLAGRPSQDTPVLGTVWPKVSAFLGVVRNLEPLTPPGSEGPLVLKFARRACKNHLIQVPRRTSPGTWPLVTVPLAVGRQAKVGGLCHEFRV